jgi:hypothetical protein
LKFTDFESQIVFQGFSDVDGTRIFVNGVPHITEEEARAYLKMTAERYPTETILSLTISAIPDEPESVCLDAEVQPIQFQRIRRITGYLVGTLDRFNNAKRAEEHDRVKHGLH